MIKTLKTYFLLIFCMLASAAAAAGAPDGSWVLRGIVRDSVTLEPVGWASILAEGTSKGVLSREDGTFTLRVPKGCKSLSVTSIGYEKQIVPLRRTSYNLLSIHLKPSDYTMAELVVTKKKEHYTKKNNPAVDFVRRIRSSAYMTDPKKIHDNYNFRKYERMTMGISNFKPDEDSTKFFNQDFVRRHVDTSEVSGKPVLSFSVKEKTAEYHFSSDRGEREYVTAQRSEGIDELIDPAMLEGVTADLLREINLYQNSIPLMRNRFVSPLSNVAPDFYKFYLSDTVMVGDERCIVLTFVPRVSETMGFIGQIYVPEGDSTMFIKKVSMRIPQKINLNFVDKLFLSQEFSRAEDGTRLKTRDDLVVEMKFFGSQGLYMRRNTVYDDHNFLPSIRPEVFKSHGSIVVAPDADTRDSLYWEQARRIELPKGEKSVSTLMAELRKKPFFFWSEKVFRAVSDGYAPTAGGGKSKVDLGPILSLVSKNNIEGWRFRVGAVTTANLSKRWFGRGYLAYGTKDHKWKYNAEAEYSFIDKKRHAREFPIRSIRVSHQYDTNHLGQNFIFSNADNLFLIWNRIDDNLINYKATSRVEFKYEWDNHISFAAGAELQRQEATPFVPFVNGYGKSYSHYTQSLFDLQLRIATGEKYIQTKDERIPINQDTPEVMLRHTFSPKGFAGNMFALNRTELSYRQRIWLSAWGHFDLLVKGAHLWNATPYPGLLTPVANTSYMVMRESFSLLNPMEFLFDSSVEWHWYYRAHGALFNYIPLIKRLGWREVVKFRGLWGRLSSKNNPASNPDVFRFPAQAIATNMNGQGPYMEISAGVENIFHFFEIEYCWRLSYRHQTGLPDHGLRVGFNLTF